MTARYVQLFGCVSLSLVLCGAAQGALTRGDVVVSAYEDRVDENGDPIGLESNLSVYRRDGTLKAQLVDPEGRFFGEPLVYDGLVFFGARAPDAIERVRDDGTRLSPFTTDVVNINYLSPGPAGGLLAVNGSGEIYVFAPDGALTRFRNAAQDLPAYGGIDLGSDQCTAFYTTQGALVRWNACVGSEPELLGNLGGASFGFRVRRDGTFLVAIVRPEGGVVIHASSDGNVIREYPIQSPQAIALDIDGTSFWTNAGNVLLRVDIASGAVLSETVLPYAIYGISVVGEPRAGAAATPSDVPTAQTPVLVVLVVSLAFLALSKVRIA
jgi:hypothetical protein